MSGLPGGRQCLVQRVDQQAEARQHEREEAPHPFTAPFRAVDGVVEVLLELLSSRVLTVEGFDGEPLAPRGVPEPFYEDCDGFEVDAVEGGEELLKPYDKKPSIELPQEWGPLYKFS